MAWAPRKYLLGSPVGYRTEFIAANKGTKGSFIIPIASD
jgi:hypothetical protein